MARLSTSFALVQQESGASPDFTPKKTRDNTPGWVDRLPSASTFTPTSQKVRRRRQRDHRSNLLKSQQS